MNTEEIEREGLINGFNHKQESKEEGERQIR